MKTYTIHKKLFLAALVGTAFFLVAGTGYYLVRAQTGAELGPVLIRVGDHFSIDIFHGILNAIVLNLEGVSGDSSLLVSGRVGIGTRDPSSALHLVGGDAFFGGDVTIGDPAIATVTLRAVDPCPAEWVSLADGLCVGN